MELLEFVGLSDKAGVTQVSYQVVRSNVSGLPERLPRIRLSFYVTKRPLP